MNGFQLYKQYLAKAERAQRDSTDWRYGNLLRSAFYVVGVTRLFDMLEQAETLGCRIGLVYAPPIDTTPPAPCGIELVYSEGGGSLYLHQPPLSFSAELPCS